MPRLRRLSGADAVRILEQFGFEVVDVTGSHHKLRRIVDNQRQTLVVPVHGKTVLHPGLIRKILRDAGKYIDEAVLISHFYSE